jgi:glutamate-ammonia-ligase adenylyltransferase
MPVCAMILLSQISSTAEKRRPAGAGSGLPEPADPHRTALGFAAWEAALDLAGPEADGARAWSRSPAGRRLLAAIFGNSPYLSDIAVKEWAFFSRLVEHGPTPLFAELVETVERRDDLGEDMTALMRRLRLLKRRAALVVALADLAELWPLEEQTAALSRFAEAALGAALRHLLRGVAERGRLALADPADPERDSGVFILGMGKLGGRELNYSSDIDLILLYDAARVRVGARDGAQSFFARLARDLVRILDERTSEGYVFRVDLRLRPDPASTPPALSVAAALVYYEGVGQNWERAALIKARPVAGDRAAALSFLHELRPFIWRKNLDFAAIQDIHSIKRQINAHKGGGRIAIAGHDIKTGRGGIREIEFFAQTQQLIWGGRLREVRVAPTCEALSRLAAAGRIETETAAALIADYRFLRRLEHRLQMIDDAQTHRLPGDRVGLERIAIFLGYADADAFIADLSAHLASVERHYAALFEEAPSLAGPGNLVFTGAEDDPETLRTLEQLGFADPAMVSGLVRSWHHGRLRATRSQRAREILTELVPALLRIFGATPHPDTALTRFDRFLSRLPAGVQLFSLFYANPGLIELVADIMAGAPLLAEHLARRPALLDPVLSEGFFAPPPDRAALAADLDDLLAGARDFEDALDIVRRWAGERRFQAGVQLLRRTLDGTRAGVFLADIAETAIAALLPAVEEAFARRHGHIPGAAFVVIAAGRLGSREMTLASDLDLILIYDAPPDSNDSDGAHKLPVATYYARLSQRLIGAITAPTAEGRLYEVDMRLRPSGNSGPIASSFAGFVRYQRETAWTWEHMALTRARPIAGDASLCRRITAALGAILSAPRDSRRLLVDVADMRRRVAEQFPRPSPWDLRNRPGGLVDLEFLVQYLVLREGARLPQLCGLDAERALTMLGRLGALPETARQELQGALFLLREVRALLSLFGDRSPETGALSEVDAAILARCAGAIDSARLAAEISSATARVHAWYRELVEDPARRADEKTTGESPQ